ncbi:MAG: response regulator [Methanospirillum sp.]|nr:response regulator [Methanospirillum sp.]
MPKKLLRVLHVDDQYQWRNIVSDYLTLFGEYEIISAESGEQAIDLLRVSSFDIIISDIQMPEMNGIEFLQIIRSCNESIPFIFLTGTRHEDFNLDIKESKADFIVMKTGDPPLVFSDLSQKINQAVARHRTVQALKKHQKEESEQSSFIFI